MFRTTLATCSNLDAARTTLRAAAVRNIVSRKSCTRVVMAARFSTRSRQLELVHPRKLASGVPSKCAPFLLPVRASSIVATRLYATDNERKPSSTEGDTKSQSILTRLLEEDQQQPKAVTVAERVVQAGKDTTYFLIICIGFGITAILLYFVFGELFSSNSVQQLFSAALTRIRADEKSKAILGEPISAHGEMSGRNRRRHISGRLFPKHEVTNGLIVISSDGHQEYIVDGEEYMRVQFYVSGSKQQATAHLDVKKNSRGKYECRFLFLELNGYPGGTIIIEDNR